MPKHGSKLLLATPLKHIFMQVATPFPLCMLYKYSLKKLTGAILFSTDADENLEKFAEISDGLTYFIDDTKASLDLDQAFQGCLTYQPDITVETEKDIVVSIPHELFLGSFFVSCHDRSV